VADYLVRATARAAGVRALACLTTELAQVAADQHKTAPTATVALGQALTVAALVGALLKVGQRVALRYDGDGPLERILVEAESNGHVRGFVANPAVELPLRGGEQNVAAALGNTGFLKVVRDLRLKELYEGSVPLVSGEVDQDAAYYLNQSEQVPSLVQAGVVLDANGRVSTAGGLLIQAMPPYRPEVVAELTDRIDEMPPVATIFNTGRKPEELLASIFGDTEYHLLETRPLRWQCSCSYQRTRQALRALGRAELETLLATEGQAVVDCHFCRQQYIFDGNELAQLIREMPPGE
jgi:molecular chaperone Hsp33